VSADVYSLTIIIFELLSGIDPFPGSFGQIFQAKMLDKKPDMLPLFPSNLKDLIFRGWSKEPKERPQIQEFKSALSSMHSTKRKKQFVQNDNYSKKKEGQLAPCKEVVLAHKTGKELHPTEAGNTFDGLFIGCIKDAQSLGVSCFFWQILLRG
jgi:serine/threonine protein kinase